MKKAKGTHRSMGTKGGESAGINSGLTEASSFKAGQGQKICSGTERAKPEKGGSIAK